jgi:predicted Zn-dependent protease
LNAPQHQELLNGVVFGEDPRKGYFRGSQFMHPEMRFQLTFPQGWKTQNMPQVVGAVSPQQDGVVLLGLVPNETPDSAAQKFFAQQGLQAGTVGPTNVNGISAIVGSFQAQTEQGPLAGIAMFLSHGGKTFQILGYSAAQKAAAYEGAFRSTMGSFTALTDPAAINVQPAKIALVTVSQAMTIDQFQAQYPSSVPKETIALINGIEPNAQIPAGKRMKRVQGGVAPK